MDKNSMLYWYPLVQKLEVPQPRTCMIEMSLFSDQLTKPVNAHLPEIRRAVEFCGGYPVFMRTDLMSGKFDWSKTCYCIGEQELISNIPRLVEFSETCDMIGQPVNALVFREYIEMDSKFTAFGGLPISRERRYFVRDGKVECHHPYWPLDAIQFYGPQRLSGQIYLKDLEDLNYELPSEVQLLTEYAEIVGSVLPGYWSVDFCRRLRYGWYFIDCALGEGSWHPECVYAA